MFEWFFSYLGFLKSFFIFWWNLITNSSHWWEIPLFFFGFLFSTFFVVFISSWVVIGLYSLLTLVLSGIQKVFKIKFPIIGDYLEKSLKESQERISRDQELFEKSLRNRVTVIWENRGKNHNQFTSEEFDYVIKVFGLHKEQQELQKTFSDETTFFIQKRSLIEKSFNTRREISDQDREYLQKQYDDGSLEKWFEREVRNL